MKYFTVKVKFEVTGTDSKGVEKSKMVSKTFLTDANSVPQADSQVKSYIEANALSNVSYEITSVSESPIEDLVLSDRFISDVSFICEDLASIEF